MRIIMITESAEHASDYWSGPLFKKDNIDGCTDEYGGGTREIGEAWRFEDGCNTGMLVSN